MQTCFLILASLVLCLDQVAYFIHLLVSFNANRPPTPVHIYSIDHIMSNYERSRSRPVPSSYTFRTGSAYADAFFPENSPGSSHCPKTYSDGSYSPYVPNPSSQFTPEQEAEIRKAHREAYEEAYNRHRPTYSRGRDSPYVERGRQRSYSPPSSERSYRYDSDEKANFYTPPSPTSRARSGPRRRSPSPYHYPDPPHPRQNSPSSYKDHYSSSKPHTQSRYRSPPPQRSSSHRPPPRTNFQSQPRPHPSPPPYESVIDASLTPYTYSDDEPDGLHIAPAQWNNFRSTATREELIIFFTFMCKTTTKERIEKAVGREFEDRTRRYVVTSTGTKILESWFEEREGRQEWKGERDGREKNRGRQYEEYRESSARGSGRFGGGSQYDEGYDFAYW
jgi:hypothetical protein